MGHAHVWRLAREGRVPVVELGRYRRFRLEAIEDFERAGGERERTAHDDPRSRR